MDLSALKIHRIRSEAHPKFGAAYDWLWEEFGAKDEMEGRPVIEARFKDRPGLRYEMVYIERNGARAAVRDHTAICCTGARPAIVVHLSHNLIAVPERRTGLAGWMRAIPLQTARDCAAAEGLPADTPIMLVGEMEYDDGSDPDRSIRLRAYEKAGFLKIDPRRVAYHQPDFRAPEVIDATGGPRPLAFQLIVRRIGREGERTIAGGEIREIVRALYRMYGAEFRPRDMEHPLLDPERLPADGEAIALVPPTEPC